MSDHPAITLAQAIANLMASTPPTAGWSQSFTAQRSYLPIMDTAKVGPELYVFVIPAMPTPDERETRGDYLRELAVRIVVQRKLSSTANAEVDPMVALMNQIEQWMAGREPGVTGMVWARMEPSGQLYYEGDLNEFNVFNASATAVYQVRRTG